MARLRVRLSVRFWMALALIVALLTAGLIRRSAHFRELADWHASEEQRYLAADRLARARALQLKIGAGNWAAEGVSPSLVLGRPAFVSRQDVEAAIKETEAAANVSPEDAEAATKKVEAPASGMSTKPAAPIVDPKQRLLYHRALRSKYQRAAARPWYLVPSDPPVP